MKDGTSKTRKGDREIISISLPIPVYDALEEVCNHFNVNRSSLISSAIVQYLQNLGTKVGEP